LEKGDDDAEEEEEEEEEDKRELLRSRALFSTWNALGAGWYFNDEWNPSELKERRAKV